jgi:hypothetical protein
MAGRPEPGRSEALNMALVNHWIAIDETGRGAIGLTREDVLNALPGARNVATATYACWDLSIAMCRGCTLPIRFEPERKDARSPHRALVERR